MKCVEQDYIEIACLYHLRVKLRLKDDCCVAGVAKNTVYNGLRQECILIDTDEGSSSVPLDMIRTMQALVANPHFTLIQFSG
ncbi:Rho-binding antiterminator [uncultured Paraglaciecola sp.]|uniref:Rho-binding antiterminator n=1 Tax=uncultured Paraglaciecola sp. TaxID=1765024 RepID=UPI0030D7368E|tara:strand:- start:3474 stop:3719 length:246 start_codon:yes stop_codon:yes gene_type:complete